MALRHVPWGTKSHFENIVTLTPPLKVTFSPKYNLYIERSSFYNRIVLDLVYSIIVLV